MKKSIVGILAHVDAGKTTLAESLLCACGVIERAGRVDHGDAFLDNGDMERKRGITIFSKQARIRWKDVDITLLDTPGHVDFSAEMERTLQVLDAAVLVIDGSDGVQGDVHTLWRLLKRYEVPVFLFVNKMDQPGTDPEKVLTELQKKLDSNITSVGKLLQPGDNEGERETELEHAAMCSEALMEEYLETGELSAENISDTVAERKLFPCFFGSALKQWGITELLDGLNAYLPQPEYPEEFGARVYKIGRDNAGIRLSYLKVTGGSLRVKMPVGNSRSGAGEEIWEEKCDQLRLYNGGSYEAVDTVKAGEVCAVTGLTKTFAGQGLGYESENSTPILETGADLQTTAPSGGGSCRGTGETTPAGRGRTAAACVVAGGKQGNPYAGHGTGADGNPQKYPVGAFRSGSGIRCGKHCIQGNSGGAGGRHRAF